MSQRISAIPESKGFARRDPKTGELVPVSVLKGPAGPSVEQARADMLAAKEVAVTTRGGASVPKFIQQAENRGQGGNTPVVAPQETAPVTVHTPQNELPPTTQDTPKDNRTLQALRFNAQQKLQRAGYRNGSNVDLVAEVKKGVLDRAEAEALLGAPLVMEDEAAPEPETEAEEVVVPVAVVPTTTRVAADEGQVRKVENSAFVGSIFRDGKEWVAEIVYKNGAGTERFTANSKDDLMTKLLEGKGHGTIKVREVVKENKRRLLYGEENDTWEFFFDEVKTSHGLTVEQYNALPEASRALIQDTIQAQQILAFQQNWPEYYATARNFEKIGKYLNKREWPLTYRNLELAYKDLTADEELDLRPAERVDVAPQAAPVVSAQPVASDMEDSIPTVAAPAASVAPVVRKRGTTGLVPGSSSVSSTDAAARTEDGTKQRERSTKELKALPLAELERIAKQGRKYGVRY